MTYYSLDTSAAHRQFLNISLTQNTKGKANLVFQLPAWRPGRYELGNFAKNVRDFKAFDTEGNKLPVVKRSKDSWLIRTEGIDELTVNYNYYANELNGGSTFLSENLLYVNPVNCFIYELGNESEECSVSIPVASNEQVAHSFEKLSNGDFKATSFHDLVDCPFIVSARLQQKSYESHGVKFNVWFEGEVKPEWDKVMIDFKKFTDFQLDKFGSIPVKEFHFLNLISPYTAYHGVEHFKSTVIHLGPSYDIFDKLYTELLGVSSHELYHVWNVKSIRPEEMFPYDYAKENYTRLGFVAEGVTTYMGDRILFECGVFDKKQYHKEFLEYVTRHFHNDGRLHYSVADSSYDTWLDGYVQGVPGRKTSIYVEGCLIAYICDMRIRQATNGDKSLHDVMTKMYELTNQRVGYSDTIYQEVLELIGGISFQDIFDNLINGIEDFKPYLTEALKFENKKLIELPTDRASNWFGIKGVQQKSEYTVKLVLENSAAYSSGVVAGDVIIAVNGIPLNNDLDKWLGYFNHEDLTLSINRNGSIIQVNIEKVNEFQFYKYEIQSTEL